MIIARAPARISFGGGGTDLAAYYERYGGLVISSAVSRYCYVTVKPTGDRSIRISAVNYQQSRVDAPGTLPPVDGVFRLPAAAIERYADRGILDQGLDLTIMSEIPPGSGLGSSSATIVALLTALDAYTGTVRDPSELAEAACDIEIERLGMPIGKHDQHASAFGGLNSYEFGPDSVRVQPVDLSREQLDCLNSRLLLFGTGETRNSSDILKQQQEDTGKKQHVVQLLHRIKELAIDVRTVLESGDLDAFGDLLHENWQQKKQLSGKISSTKIDDWYDAGRQAGAHGGRLLGAGGGGFLLFYCRPERQAEMRAAMERHGLQEMGFDLDVAGATVLHGLPNPQPSLAVR